MATESNEAVGLCPVQLENLKTKPIDSPVVSYGTFFPQLPKSWLGASKESGLPGRSQENDNTKISHSFGSGGFSYPPVGGPVARQFSRGSESGFESDYTQRSGKHSRRDSLSLSPIVTPSESPLRVSPVPERDTAWIDTLINEMDKTISKAEEELNELSSSAEDEGFSEVDVDHTAAIVSINTDTSGYDMIEIDDQYRSDEDGLKNCRSAFGILCRLKRVLDAECARLDSLVGMGAPDEDIDAEEQVLSRSAEFRTRINSSLEKVRLEVGKIRQKNEMMIDGVRHRGWYPESPIVKKVKATKTSCFTWLHAVLFGSVMVFMCFLCSSNLHSKHWVIILRLIRSPLITVFLLYLYGVNMKTWAKYGINYVAIFNHHPESAPTPARIFKMAGVLTIVLSVLVAVIIAISPFTTIFPIKIIALAMWLILLAFLLNPFKYFQRKARYKFIFIIVHILLAPFVFVFFTDFYLADQFNSTVAIFLDMHYSMCYIFTDSWFGNADTKICTSSGNGIRPVISFLPAMWRMLQCFRCFYDTLSVSHLVNAGKYFTTFPVIFFAALYSVKVKGDIFESSVNEETSWLVIMWAVSGLIHAGYTFLWDVCCDWGLWDIIKCKTFQRQLLYKRKGLYIAAIFFDLVLRFTWTLKLSLAIVWQIDSDLLYTGTCVV